MVKTVKCLRKRELVSTYSRTTSFTQLVTGRSLSNYVYTLSKSEFNIVEISTTWRIHVSTKLVINKSVTFKRILLHFVSCFSCARPSVILAIFNKVFDWFFNVKRAKSEAMTFSVYDSNFLQIVDCTTRKSEISWTECAGFPQCWQSI